MPLSGFCSNSSTYKDSNGGATERSNEDFNSVNYHSDEIYLSPLFWRDKHDIRSCRIGVVDSDTLRVSSGLGHVSKTQDYGSEIGSFPADSAGDEVVNEPVLVNGDPDFDEIEDMRIHGNLFYKIDRSSREFEEYKFDFHRRKKENLMKDDQKGSKKMENPIKDAKNGNKKKENPSCGSAAIRQKSERSKEYHKGGNRKERMDPSSFISEQELRGIVKDRYVITASVDDIHSSVEKKRRMPTFNQLTGPYHEPFCLDIYVSKGSVRACIIHRVTSKVVAVAHSISKDMKFDLGSTKNAATCAAVGKVLAQRAMADDIHDVIFTPRRGDKLEGKLQIVLQSIMENGINVKLKLKQRNTKRAADKPTA
ncbi:hypothetical protein Ancab_030383 [Ancistrocladus abbreviatus]